MIWLTMIIFPAWKIVKVFSSIFYILDSSFDNTFLIRRMKMMFKIQESTCLWIPYHVPPSVEILCFPYFLIRELYKPFRHKHVSFDGDVNTKNRLISWLYSNPHPKSSSIGSYLCVQAIFLWPIMTSPICLLLVFSKSILCVDVDCLICAAAVHSVWHRCVFPLPGPL